MARERITTYLTADHERLGLLLACAASGDEVDPVAYDAFRRGLLRHIAIEEKLLFPLVPELPHARALRADHARIARLLATSPDLERCGELAYLLGRHDRLEEGPGGAYEACEAALGEAASVRLARRARAMGDVKVGAYRDLDPRFGLATPR